MPREYNKGISADLKKALELLERYREFFESGDISVTIHQLERIQKYNAQAGKLLDKNSTWYTIRDL